MSGVNKVITIRMVKHQGEEWYSPVIGETKSSKIDAQSYNNKKNWQTVKINCWTVQMGNNVVDQQL